MDVQLPDRFISRSADDLLAGLKVVTAWYWHLHSQGEEAAGSDTWQGAVGALEAVHWLAGMTPFPPGYARPMERTRSNLWRLATYSIMVIDHDGEELDQLDPNVNGLDFYRLAGAGVAYRWAIRLTPDLPGSDLLPEQVRAARLYYSAQQARSAAA